MPPTDLSLPKTYAQSGVDIDAGETALDLIKDRVEATYNKNVLAGLGAFGGLYDLSFLKTYREPLLVTSTDGVGTKTKLAAALGRYDTVGYDIVNHCVNDILVQGATPHLFLDYIAAGRLEPERAATIIGGVAKACKAAGIVLIGGETAELPGVYVAGEFDLVGTVIGVVDRAELVTGETIQPGDAVFALMSGGLQTNGFSLARSVLDGHYQETLGDRSVGEALLHPHRNYVDTIRTLRTKLSIKGMAHITGGGMPGNLPRILPEGLGATIDTGSWPIPPIFNLIQQRGEIATSEMFRVFNMGAGFLFVVSAEKAEQVQALSPEPVLQIGHITDDEGVRFSSAES